MRTVTKEGAIAYEQCKMFRYSGRLNLNINPDNCSKRNGWRLM